MLDLSIVIPVYNTSNRLKNCLNSILNNNLNNTEIIIIDDCSSNNETINICKNYSKKKKIKYYKNNKNLGVGASRNIGIKKAKGKYILFVDSDDEIIGDVIKKFFLEKKLFRYDIIIGDYINERYVKRNEKKIFEFKTKNIKKDICLNIKKNSNFSSNCWRYIFSRNFIESNKLKFLNSSCYEDTHFVTKAICLTKNYCFIKKPFYFYKFQKNGLSNSIIFKDNKKIILSLIDILKDLSYFHNNFKLSKYKKVFLKLQIENLKKILILHIFSQKSISLKYRNKIIRNLKNLKKINNLINKYFNKNFMQIIKSKNTKFLLTNNKDFEKVFKKINSYSKIYIFGADLFTKALINFFKIKKRKIELILDNNILIKNFKISGIKVAKPKKIKLQLKEKKTVIVPFDNSNFLKKIKKQFYLIDKKNIILAPIHREINVDY